MKKFLIGGPQKCGTTALWDHLYEHPEVSLARIKEPRFFSTAPGNIALDHPGAVGPRLAGTYVRGLPWYDGLFDFSDTTNAQGEASTVYFGDTTSPTLIKQHWPDARLVFLLREPVARAYSHYWQEHKLGFKFPTFEEMVATNHPRFRYYCDVSHYQINLERYFESFSHEQVLVLTLDEFRAAPEATFNRVCQHIGISDFQPRSLGKNSNLQTTPRNRSLAYVVSGMQALATSCRLPAFIRKPLGFVRARVTRINRRKFEYAPLSPELDRDLRAIFQSDVEYVENLLGTSLPRWHSEFTELANSHV